VILDDEVNTTVHRYEELERIEDHSVRVPRAIVDEDGIGAVHLAFVRCEHSSGGIPHARPGPAQQRGHQERVCKEG